MSRTYEDPAVAGRYATARSLPGETLAAWTGRLRDLLPPCPVGRILDIGAGTGRYSEALQQAFSCEVTAVEPSDAMRAVGEAQSPPGVTWLKGSAERIPVEDGAFDLAWMSQVFHHLDEPALAVREVRRVLRPGGYFAVRNGTRETEAEIPWLKCFPEALEIGKKRMPSRSEVVERVSAAGFKVLAVEPVYQQTAPSWDSLYERISQRALSIMVEIGDEAFEQGLRRLQRWVSEQPPGQPVIEPVDLLLFQSPQA